MYAISLNTTIAPYYFMKSNSLNTFSKPNLLTISSGREGVVYNDGAEFYYAIGDIKLNGNNIDFVEIPDSVKSLNLSAINEYLRSQTMSVDNAGQLLYSVQYGMIDSASTMNYLQTGKTITFGVELVDAITNNVLGRYDEVTFDENNMFNYDKQGYEVSLEGIGTNREVYLRLSTTSNDETSGYSLTQRYSDETILGKTHTKKINYTGTEKPTEYALFQNYPNPFNPMTTITYQIPKEGLVTLKIYDILGKEVATLINEEKQAGKYSIDFNASKLSSGVYLYELRSNEYKSTKKLLLMK
ncbi:MAG: T9SS type A sorting domain-containing protein [Ignavibacteria bacterium]|nr:T9SS type A sorting domain-containing protein [Ignavibacteria bacterium]